MSNQPGMWLPQDVADRLRQEIDRQYSSQRDVADRLDISHHHLSAILCARNRVSWDLAAQLAGMLGLELTLTVKRRSKTLPARPDKVTR